jgi:nitrogen fixation NifU-like protein
MSDGNPIDTLYREVVLDHHRSPRGSKPLDRVDAEAAGANPACGDEVRLQLKLDGDRIEDAAVISSGCAISTASGSMLAEIVAGLSLADARRVADVFKQVMHGEPAPQEVDLGDLEALTGVRKFPVRVKCALLAWVTLLDAMLARQEGREPKLVSTETLNDQESQHAVE